MCRPDPYYLSGVKTKYTWDNNGNMTGKKTPEETPEETWVYEWNYDNKMVRAEKNEVPVSAYTYDYRGERIIKDTPEGTTRFLIDNNNKTGYSQALRETDQSNTELGAYTFGDDLISQKRTETSYYHYDGLGSTRAITDSNANITDSMKYYAFGSILSKIGSTNVSHLFTGENYDFNIGYYYLRARLYNPSNGRFVSLDPFQGILNNPLSLHKYIYTHNNPIDDYDHSGLFSIGVIMTTLSVINSLSSVVLPNYYFLTQRLLGPEVVFTYATKEICWEPHRPCPNCPPICYEAINEVVSRSAALPPPLVPSRIGNYEGTILRPGVSATVCSRACDPTIRENKKFGTFYIDTSHPAGKDIHGGGSRDEYPCQFRQEYLWPTAGCIRMWNDEGQDLCNALLWFWDRYPNTDIKYVAR